MPVKSKLTDQITKTNIYAQSTITLLFVEVFVGVE